MQHTGAGHDAGILTQFVPTAMLFVRNPTGVSHSPEEYVEIADAEAGARALAAVLSDLLLPQPHSPRHVAREREICCFGGAEATNFPLSRAGRDTEGGATRDRVGTAVCWG
ncbi:M20/M25/M40 family metallo-hydrolase [Cryobacterium aureum]|uniref:M20/M25/M40 family metallo-hydrolase n=1 Tax=Cryobacterium aureum TaxID=995037 RepID=UPI000CF3B2E1